MKNIKKIALVFFPINDVGGIITWNKQIQIGFERLGVQSDYFYCTPGTKYGCDPEADQLKERYTMIAGTHLSYNAKNIKNTIKKLNEYDMIIFTKTSPHPTKDNLKYPDIDNWKLLYSETTAPKVVVFHDALWESTNAWSAEVAPYVSLCIAAQKKFIHSVNRYPADCEKYHDFFPADVQTINAEGLSSGKKEPFGMVATQWLKWKNHKKLLPQLPETELQIYLFGAGMEWHYLKKTPEYLEGIGLDFKMSKADVSKYIQTFTSRGDKAPTIIKDKIKVHNSASPHMMMGTVTYPILQHFYSKAFLSIDLSTRGYTNYTHFEPLLYRSLSLIESRVVADEDNIIPEDCCVSYDMEDLAAMLNYLKSQMNNPELKKIAERGFKFSQGMDCVKVSKRIIDTMENI